MYYFPITEANSNRTPIEILQEIYEKNTPKKTEAEDKKEIDLLVE